MFSFSVHKYGYVASVRSSCRISLALRILGKWIVNEVGSEVEGEA